MSLSGRSAAAGGERSRAYLHLLLALLLSAAFFDGYDAQVQALLLPQIQESFHASTAALGLAHVPIALGQLISFFLVRISDRKGRRPLLLWSVVGYTVFTALTALAPDLWSFVGLQSCAQVFIGAEFGVAATVVVEEFPPDRRARALGTLLTVGPMGGIVVGALLAGGLANGPLGWRSFYLVGLVPLAVVAVARRRMVETAPFEALDPSGSLSPASSSGGTSMFAAWMLPWRGRLVLVGVVSFLQQLPASAAVAWWAFYAERERGYSTSLVALMVVAAYGVGTFGYYACGHLMQRYGRRPVALAYTVGSVTCGLALFGQGAVVPSFFFLLFAVFFGLGIGPALSAFATELFPTSLRAQSSSWVRNWFGVCGQAAGPAIVGVLGDRYSGAIGSIGGSVSLLLLISLPNLWLIWRYMPEAKGRDLDELSPESARRRGGSPSTLVLLVSATALFLGVAGVSLFTFGTGRHRPGGVASDWLNAIGERGSPGGRKTLSDALHRFGGSSEEQRLEALAPSFARVEVGHPLVASEHASVAFALGLHPGEAVRGELLLSLREHSWVVAGLSPLRQLRHLPSTTLGPRAFWAGAPFAWLGGALGGAILLGAGFDRVVKVVAGSGEGLRGWPIGSTVDVFADESSTEMH